MELNPQVPRGPGKHSKCQAQDWDWHSKKFTPKLHRAHQCELTYFNPPFPLVLRPHPPTKGQNGAQGYLPIGEYQSKKKTIWKGTRRHWRIKTRIWHKKQGFGRKKNCRRKVHNI